MMSQIYNVIIIGSGPAGLTAAIYTARAKLNPLVLAGYQWGGQLMNTTEIENFPGFPEGILGPELMDKMLKQAERFGANIVYKDVFEVEFNVEQHENIKLHRVSDGENTYLTKSVIVATGAKPRKLGIKGENEFWSKGVSSCATCDGAFYKNRVVAVIGGGDSAMEEATFLTKFASKVYVIHRRDHFRASQIMLERAKENSKIEMVLNTTVSQVIGDKSVSKLKLLNVVTNKESEIDVQGMFLAIGHIPEVGLFSNKLSLDELGYLHAVENSMSNIPGVFIAGDVHDHRYRQAITAAGEGCKSAMDLEKWLEINDPVE